MYAKRNSLKNYALKAVSAILKLFFELASL
jgi:hypothetical protein